MPLFEPPLSENITDSLNAADNPSATNAMLTANATPSFTDERQSVQVTNFDSGSLPVGWTGSVTTGGNLVYNASDRGVSPGLALASLTTASGARVSILVGSGSTNNNFVRTFTGAVETTSFIQLKWGSIPSPTNHVEIFGWINSNAFTPVNTIGNTLAIVYDPSNVTGTNSGLITNLFLLARSTYGGLVGNTVVNLGVTFDTDNYRSFRITYDNVLNEVRVYRDNILLTTLTELSNVPGGLIRGSTPTVASAGLQNGFYIANQGVAGTISAIRVAKHALITKFV